MAKWALLLLSVCLATICQAGTYMRFDTRDKPLPYCQFDYLDFVDKDRISKIYNPIYIDKPVQIMVTSPTYFGWSWAGLTPLTGLKIKSHQGEIKPEILKRYAISIYPKTIRKSRRVLLFYRSINNTH